MSENLLQNSNASYNLNQNNAIFYVFEIDIKFKDNSTIKIRRIKNIKVDTIIYSEDFIKNNINKIKFTIFDINDPMNTLIVKKKFTNQINNFFILSKDNIVFNFILLNENVLCNYKFLK